MFYKAVELLEFNVQVFANVGLWVLFAFHYLIPLLFNDAYQGTSQEYWYGNSTMITEIRQVNETYYHKLYYELGHAEVAGNHWL